MQWHNEIDSSFPVVNVPGTCSGTMRSMAVPGTCSGTVRLMAATQLSTYLTYAVVQWDWWQLPSCQIPGTCSGTMSLMAVTQQSTYLAHAVAQWDRWQLPSCQHSWHMQWHSEIDGSYPAVTYLAHAVAQWDRWQPQVCHWCRFLAGTFCWIHHLSGSGGCVPAPYAVPHGAEKVCSSYSATWIADLCFKCWRQIHLKQKKEKNHLPGCFKASLLESLSWMLTLGSTEIILFFSLSEVVLVIMIIHTFFWCIQFMVCLHVIRGWFALRSLLIKSFKSWSLSNKVSSSVYYHHLTLPTSLTLPIPGAWPVTVHSRVVQLKTEVNILLLFLSPLGWALASVWRIPADMYSWNTMQENELYVHQTQMLKQSTLTHTKSLTEYFKTCL